MQAAWVEGSSGHFELDDVDDAAELVRPGVAAPRWVQAPARPDDPIQALRHACATSTPGRRGPHALLEAEQASTPAGRLEHAAQAIRDRRTPEAARHAISRWISQQTSSSDLDSYLADFGLGWANWLGSETVDGLPAPSADLAPEKPSDAGRLESEETRGASSRHCSKVIELRSNRAAADGPLVSTGTSERGVSRLTAPVHTDTRPERELAPDYVVRCPGSQYESRLPPLVLRTWDRGNPDKQKRGLVLCGSWRCDSCQDYRAAVDFARMKEAFGPYESSDCVSIVLTLDRNGYYSGERFADADQAFSELSRRSRNFLSRINRLCKKRGWDPPGSRWVATVEAHLSGWPHLNIVMVAPELAEYLRAGAARRRAAVLALGGSEHQAKTRAMRVSGPLLEAALGAGWGPISSAESTRSKGALAGYIVKLAKKMDKAAGEIAKMTQRPTKAPIGLRRLRAGVRFLPPRRVSGKTGVVLHSRWHYSGRYEGPVVRTYGRPSRKERTVLDRWATRAVEVDEAIEQESRFLKGEREVLQSEACQRPSNEPKLPSSDGRKTAPRKTDSKPSARGSPPRLSTA